MLPAYFAKIWRLLAPGGLLLNHGITAGGTRNEQLGAAWATSSSATSSRRRTAAHVARAGGAQRGGAPRRWTSRTCARTTRARCGAGATASRRTSDMPARSPANPSWARLSALPRRQRDVLRARLDLAVPDARVAPQRPHRVRRGARCTIGLSVPTRLHVPLSRSHAPQVQVQGSRRRQPCSPRPATRCCCILGREPLAQGHPRSRRHARRARGARGRRAGGASRPGATPRPRPPPRAAPLPPRESVTLRQRAWPLAEMIRRAHAAKADIVWGV